MSKSLRKTLFLLFFLSGFCSLLYQVVWLRLAFASFGITTHVLSLVLSVFMLGLAVGSWGAGHFVSNWTSRSNWSPIILYGLAELLIGVGALVVPRAFIFGANLLLRTGAMESATYLSLSAIVIVASILPWCVCMGATFPLMLEFVRARENRPGNSFSYLYLANVIGAMVGTLATPLVFVELLGFRNTLVLAALGNFAIAVLSFRIARQSGAVAAEQRPLAAAEQRLLAAAEQRLLAAANNATKPATLEAVSLTAGAGAAERPQRFLTPLILFATGFSSMALEVVWTRAFTPVLNTQVYSFASLLFCYLLATWAGSYIYRRDLAAGRVWSTNALLGLLVLCGFAQIVLDDPRLQKQVVIVLASIMPFSAVLGYLTPKLIDEHSRGRPRDAGAAYAWNVVGCIVGPLFASYILLPNMGVRWSMIVAVTSLVVPAILTFKTVREGRKGFSLALGLSIPVATLAGLWSLSYEEIYATEDAVTYRDHTATVIAYGKGNNRRLMVNGIEITLMSSITKVMAHFPLSCKATPPESALVICFGMGATYRSLMSWGIHVTAVELVPSVRDAFGYFSDDAAKVLADPRGNVVIDDGRRFLERTSQKYDVITLDPPPPVEAAGSSLLYSEEFYRLVKPRLKTGGILHQWFPGGELEIYQAVLRSLMNSFPHVKVVRGMDGWGMHFLASEEPLSLPTVDQMMSRMPPAAQADLMEYGSKPSLRAMVAAILDPSKEVPATKSLNPDVGVVVTDDHPFNEYYALRRLRDYFLQAHIVVD